MAAAEVVPCARVGVLTSKAGISFSFMSIVARDSTIDPGLPPVADLRLTISGSGGLVFQTMPECARKQRGSENVIAIKDWDALDEGLKTVGPLLADQDKRNELRYPIHL